MDDDTSADDDGGSGWSDTSAPGEDGGESTGCACTQATSGAALPLSLGGAMLLLGDGCLMLERRRAL